VVIIYVLNAAIFRSVISAQYGVEDGRLLVVVKQKCHLGMHVVKLR